MHIRSLQPTDLPAYFHLRTALWPDSADDFEAEVSPMLEHPNLASFVAETNDRLVGFAEASLRNYAEGCDTSPVGYLEGWYVAPEHRSQGIGRKLVEAAETWAREKGCLEFASDTELHNVHSQKAHAQLGFEEVERIVCFKKSL